MADTIAWTIIPN